MTKMRKIVFTSLVSVIYTLFYADLLYAQLFRQDFESSSALSSYISGTPTNQQFTSIAVAGTSVNGTVSIVNNSGNNVLQMSVVSGSNKTCYFNRITDFDVSGSPPTTLIVQFDLQVTVSGGTNTSAGIFRIGSAFADNAVLVANADIYARFSINLTNNNNEFQVRDISSTTNSATFSGKNKITFVLNNSGFSQNYFAPNGTTQTVANDTYDLWVGSTLVFNDLAVVTATQTLSDMKFIFDGDNSTIQLDNFLISENLNVLPVTWLRLNTKSIEKQIVISWETMNEKDNFLYEIERADEKMLFYKIGEMKPSIPNTKNIYQYQFIDKNPLKGTNYYRIKQIDIDGTYAYSKVVQGKSEQPASTVLLYPNPTKDVLNLHFAERGSYQIAIFNHFGEIVIADSCETIHWQTKINRLPSGIYIVKISNTQNSNIQKVIVEK